MRPFAVAIVAILVVAAPIVFGVEVLLSSGEDSSTVVAFVVGAVGFSTIICLLGYAAIRFHEQGWRRSAPREWKSDFREYQESLEERISASSLACRHCGSAAAPILNSKNRYRCSECGREFADAEHSLFDVEEYIRLNPRPSDRPYPLRP
jgi:DNA-directed RNA polymerase subunit RPC12/RpoP